MKILKQLSSQEQEKKHWVSTDVVMLEKAEGGYEYLTAGIDKLGKETVSAIYSSQFARAQETAEIINSKHNLDLIFDERLREVFL